MNLYRLRLHVQSHWLTPWQADTLSGMLCWTLARTEGADVLRREVLDPASHGSPPFVLSDAFPSGLLPMPAVLRANQSWPAEQRKQVKRARWLSVEDFYGFQKGVLPPAERLLPDDVVHQTLLNLRNKLDRTSGTTGAAGESGLFSVEETFLSRDWLRTKEGPNRPSELVLYVRTEDEYRDRFADLMRELALTGFGADVSVGKGQFSIASQALEPASELDDVVDANGCVVLSTFQPGPDDPTNGAWEAFTKYGKVGPDFGIENVFKRPLVMLRPGASFYVAPQRKTFGRYIAMEELLAPETRSQLQERQTPIAHLAFGVAVPFSWKD